MKGEDEDVVESSWRWLQGLCVGLVDCSLVTQTARSRVGGRIIIAAPIFQEQHYNHHPRVPEEEISERETLEPFTFDMSVSSSYQHHQIVFNSLIITLIVTVLSQFLVFPNASYLTRHEKVGKHGAQHDVLGPDWTGVSGSHVLLSPLTRYQSR